MFLFILLFSLFIMFSYVRNQFFYLVYFFYSHILYSHVYCIKQLDSPSSPLISLHVHLLVNNYSLHFLCLPHSKLFIHIFSLLSFIVSVIFRFVQLLLWFIILFFSLHFFPLRSAHFFPPTPYLCFVPICSSIPLLFSPFFPPFFPSRSGLICSIASLVPFHSLLLFLFHIVPFRCSYCSCL